MGMMKPVTFTEEGITVTADIEHCDFYEAREKGLGILYFIECNGLIKIGYTKRHLTDRMKDFETGNPAKLNICLYQWGTLDGERDLHQTFAKDRVKGEWFRPSDHLKQYIRDWGGYYPEDLP